MDYKTLLTIVILILISSQLWNIIWDIGKGALYIVILLLALTYLDPNSGDMIKNFIRKLINLDFSFVPNLLSTVSKFVLGVFNKLPKFDAIQEEIKTESISELKPELKLEPEPKSEPKPVPKLNPKLKLKPNKKK